MRNVYRFATLALVMLVVSVCGFSQKSATKEATTPTLNLVRGAIGPMGSNTSWANYSLLTLVPGAGLIPITSTQTVFYLGFTAGSEADISNMVLYTTVRGTSTITAVTPVTRGGVSNPSISLTSTSVCPVQPLSASDPCIVRFDPTSIALSALNDYYFVVYFTNDSNNESIGGAEPSYNLSTLLGWYVGSVDETRLTVGESLPSGCCHVPYFVMFVMSN